MSAVFIGSDILLLYPSISLLAKKCFFPTSVPHSNDAEELGIVGGGRGNRPAEQYLNGGSDSLSCGSSLGVHVDEIQGL